MAHLGLPLKHRLPEQSWREVPSYSREEKLSLPFIAMPPLEPQGMERKWIPCAPAVSRCLYKLGIPGNGCHFRGVQFSGTGALQSCKQPVVFVDQVTSLTQHNILHSNFSFCSQFPWFTSHGLHRKKSSVSASLLCFLFPLPIMCKETAKNKYEVRIYYFKIQFLTKAETQASYADYLIPWNVLGYVL